MTFLVVVLPTAVWCYLMWRATSAARCRGLIICRTMYRLDFAILMIAGVAIGVGIWLRNGLSDALLTMGVWVIVGSSPIGVLWAIASLARAHWHHEEDCKYGPRRGRGGAAARLSWRKVAIRPGFAPT